MKRKCFTVEQIIALLREAEVQISSGKGQNPRAPCGPLFGINWCIFGHETTGNGRNIT
jgi:hypothetical protein